MNSSVIYSPGVWFNPTDSNIGNTIESGREVRVVPESKKVFCLTEIVFSSKLMLSKLVPKLGGGKLTGEYINFLYINFL